MSDIDESTAGEPSWLSLEQAFFATGFGIGFAPPDVQELLADAEKKPALVVTAGGFPFVQWGRHTELGMVASYVCMASLAGQLEALREMLAPLAGDTWAEYHQRGLELARESIVGMQAELQKLTEPS